MKKSIPKPGVLTGTLAAVLFLCVSGFAESLDMATIFENIDTRNPELRAAGSDVEVAESEIDQAKLYPNPELEVGTANFGKAEAEVMLSQPLELGGKRQSRVAAAELRNREAVMRLEATRLRLHAEALRRAYALMAINSRIAVVDTMLSLAVADKQGIDRRIEAGAAMELDGIRSQIGIAEIQMQREALREQKGAVGNHLAALWGDSLMTAELSDTLPGIPPAVLVYSVLQELPEHPEAQLATIKVRLREAELSQAKAEVFPEAALQGGYLRNNEVGENAALFGFSIGLPLFNRNQGTISAQKNMVNAAQEEQNAQTLAMHSDIRALVSELTTIRSKLSTLEQQIIPQLAKVHTSLKDYYSRGLVSILEVLQSRSKLVEKELETVDLRAEWAQTAADLFEISGVLYWEISQEQ